MDLGRSAYKGVARNYCGRDPLRTDTIDEGDDSRGTVSPVSPTQPTRESGERPRPKTGFGAFGA